MPRRETPRRIAITRHTSDYSLAELDISEVDREVYNETTAEFIELPRRPEGLVINSENWGDFIDAIVEDAVKEVLYGPEANRLALRSIQAAFADAANIEVKTKKKKKNIFRRFLNFMCFC
ncbi:uncharacterized protein LOC111131152 [Crassostrea virginica]